MNIAEIRFNKVQIDSQLSQMKEFFQNTENDFDERWEAFEYWANLSKESHKSYIYHGLDDILCQDYFCYEGHYHAERYANIDLTNLDLEEVLCDSGPFEELTGAKFNEEHVEQVAEYLYILCKEQLMKDGIASFTYDW